MYIRKLEQMQQRQSAQLLMMRKSQAGWNSLKCKEMRRDQGIQWCGNAAGFFEI